MINFYFYKLNKKIKNMSWYFFALLSLGLYSIQGILLKYAAIKDCDKEITTLYFLLGVKQAIPLLIMILSTFLILINGQIVIRLWRKKNYSFGGYLVHTGVGLMFIGIIASSGYDQSVKLTFPKDTPKEVYGYQIVYKGRIPAPDGKDRVVLEVDGNQTMAKFYWSDYSQAYMVGPAVKNTILQDYYVYNELNS